MEVYIGVFLLLTILVSLAVVALVIRYRSKIFLQKVVEEPTQTDFETGYSDVLGHEIFFQHFKNQKDTTFVLIHGIGASHFCWRFLPHLLKSLGNVMVLDLPGFGNSSKNPDYSHGVDDQAKLVHEFLEYHKVQNSILVGSSMGGTIALWMSYLYPQYYRKLVLVSPAVAPKRARLVHIPSVFTVAKIIGEKVLSRKLIENIVKRLVVRQNLVTDDVIDTYYEPYKNNPEAMLCFIKATNIFKEVDIWKKLEKIEAAVLLTWGKDDLITPYRHTKRFKKLFPHWQYSFHPFAGHHIQEDDPEWLAKQIEDWLSLSLKLNDQP